MTKIAIVTGATSGLGLETARQLAERGYQIGLLARNRDKAHAAAESIGRTAEIAPVVFHCDMAELAQVRQAAGEIGARFPRIDVLINNAGVINMKRRVTVDGYEETFAVNHLAQVVATLNTVLDLAKNLANLIFDGVRPGRPFPETVQIRKQLAVHKLN